jgi:hypothetical protein
MGMPSLSQLSNLAGVFVVFLIGICGILITVCLHSMAITFLIGFLKRRESWLLVHQTTMRRSWVVAAVASFLATKHALDILIWAAAYWTFAGQQLTSFENAYYFSAVTYTSLGYGDIVLTNRWRMLCSFEAMGGMLMFGLSTAILFSIVQRLWINTDPAKSP